MNLITKVVLIFATILIIGGGCFTLIYFKDDILAPVRPQLDNRVSTIT